MARIPGYLTIYKRLTGYPADAIHAFMQEQANRASRPSIRVAVEYPDGSQDGCFEIFEPWRQNVEYAISSGPDDIYGVEFDCPGYNGGALFDFSKLSRKELKARLEQWFKDRELTGPALKITYHEEK